MHTHMHIASFWMKFALGRLDHRRGYSRACAVAHGYFLQLRKVAHSWM